MQLTFRRDLAFVTATLTYSGVSIEIANVLVDTGAASTIINADLAADAGVYVRPTDTLRRLRGVGGHEMCSHDASIASRSAITVSTTSRSRSARWTTDSSSILGMDFLRAAGARIDLDQLTLHLA